MAASRQQGGYITLFLTAFTGFVAGLVLWTGDYTGIGVIVTIASVVLLAFSLLRLRGIKPLEFTE
jgi:uncharacterized membrane protein